MESYFKVGQGDAVFWVVGLAQEEIPEPEIAGLLFEFLDDGDDRLPSRRVIRQLSPGQSLRRPNLLLLKWKPYKLGRQSLRNMLLTSRKVISFASVSRA